MKKISIFFLVFLFMIDICSVIAQTVVLPGNNSTSGNGRAPQGSRRFINTKYIITAAEMTTSGFAGVVASVGWRWNVPSPPAATGPTAQSTATVGNLKVFLKDTAGTATSFAGTTIDTNGVGYTKVIDGTIAIPSGTAEINIDVPVGGPGTGSYTPTPGSAVLLIFVYKTNTGTLATPTGAPNVFCNNLGTGTQLLTFQTNTNPPVNGKIGTASVFRPETRFGAPLLPDDIGISTANLLPLGVVVSVGKGYDITATVKNFGTNVQPAGIPVFYTVDGGPQIGPVLTVGPIAPNGTEKVIFTGGLKYIPTIAGPHVIRVLTNAGPPVVNRAPFVLNVNAFAKITAYPYLQTFNPAPPDWTISVVTAIGPTPIYGLLQNVTGPDGAAGNAAAKIDYFGGASTNSGRIEILRTPEMDFTGLNNPVLHFYVAYRTFIDETDRLEVLVSTDGGITFAAATTPYDKTCTTVPSLATLGPSQTAYNPTAAGQWRHETVSLLNVAGNSNVVIGFRATAAYGNNGWLDDIIVSNPSSICTNSPVTGPGLYQCDSFFDVFFNTTPAPPPFTGLTESSKNQITKQTADLTQSDVPASVVSGRIPSANADAIVTPSNNTDASTPATLFVSKYVNVDPGQTIAVNGSATNGNGNVGQPSVVYNDWWFTVTYDGNDQLGYANYDAQIYLTNLGFADAGDLYIVKRCDVTQNWICVNTTVSGTFPNEILKASGLTDFCDFAIAGTDAQPVELASFVSTVAGSNVILNWTTSTETNNAGFDIERALNGVWTNIGNVAGHGTSTVPQYYTFTDRNVATGHYTYRLKQIDINGNFEYFNLGNEVNVGVPNKFNLSQNYPNPFNPSTKINYDLPFDGKVSIKIFDMSGKEVATLVNEVKTAGYYSADFNASNLSSGIYFYTINAELNGQSFISTKKMTLIK